MNKNLKKAGTGLLLSTIVVGGAAAWLSTSQVATNTNSITVGKTSIIFENQQNTVNLTDTFPMTAEYAAANLTPYTYTLHNDGDVDLDYVVVPTEITGDMDITDLNILNNAKQSELLLFLSEPTDVHGNKVIERGILKAGETVTYTMTPYISEHTNDLHGKITSTNKSFKLQVLAEQDTDGQAPKAYYYPSVDDAYTSEGQKGQQGITVDAANRIITVDKKVAPAINPTGKYGPESRFFLQVKITGYSFNDLFTLENDGVIDNFYYGASGGSAISMGAGVCFDIVKPGTVKLIPNDGSGDIITINVIE